MAALSIVLYHVLLFAGAANHDATLAAQSQLVAGLALFFVISGFLLYRPFVVALSRADRNPELRAYAWRRFLRIVPAYWVAATITGLITAPEVFHKPLVFYGFGQTLSLETNTQGVSVAWTLCLEVMFYVFLPFYALAIRSAARRLASGAPRRWGWRRSWPWPWCGASAATSGTCTSCSSTRCRPCSTGSRPG